MRKSSRVRFVAKRPAPSLTVAPDGDRLHTRTELSVRRTAADAAGSGGGAR
jgi:hypothetical protein